MGLFEHWPYTNFHDLNLDWIIKKLPEVITAGEQAVQSAEDAVSAKNDAIDAKNAALNAVTDAEHAADDAEEAASIAQTYADNIADPVNSLVTQWLDDHPEATTTVQDGAITTPKLADQAVNMDKTDFFYQQSMADAYPWVVGAPPTAQNSARISLNWSQMDDIYPNFPDELRIVFKVTSNLWYSGGATRTMACTGHSVTITSTSDTVTLNGVMYGVILITKENFLTAYESLLPYVENDGAEWLDRTFAVNNTQTARIPADTVFYKCDVPLTLAVVQSGFTQDVLSADFATAVQRAMESGEGESQGEELTRNALSGKVMICLGDSYMVGMGGLLSTLAAKYEMKLDNRGVVSSSICGDVNGNKGFSPMWNRANTIVSNYNSGYAIDGTTYHSSDVGVVVFMGGANDGFGIDTWIGDGINETNNELIYGACNHIFNVLAAAFTGAKVICITQPSSYSRQVSSITDNATAQSLGFDSLAQLQGMDDVQFSNYAMALKEYAVRETAWTYGWNIIDMFHDFPTIFNPSNRSAYWQNDKLHLTASGYAIITEALDKKIVEVVTADL